MTDKIDWEVFRVANKNSKLFETFFFLSLSLFLSFSVSETQNRYRTEHVPFESGMFEYINELF